MFLTVRDAEEMVRGAADLGGASQRATFTLGPLEVQ